MSRSRSASRFQNLITSGEPTASDSLIPRTTTSLNVACAAIPLSCSPHRDGASCRRPAILSRPNRSTPVAPTRSRSAPCHPVSKAPRLSLIFVLLTISISLRPQTALPVRQRSVHAAWPTLAAPTPGPIRRTGDGAATRTRSFAIPQSACSIPSSAAAHPLNVTVVPRTGSTELPDRHGPPASRSPWSATLEFVRTAASKRNAAIDSRRGPTGAVSVFVTETTGCHPRHRWLLRARHHRHAGLLPAHALPCCRHPRPHRPARRSRDDQSAAARLPHPGQRLQYS